MRRLVLPLLATASLAACGAASAATRDFPVGGFDRIASSVTFDVHVRTGGAPHVTATGPQELLDRLQIDVGGGELRIRTQRGNWFSGWNWHGGRGRIEVSVPMLQAASLSGPGDLTIDAVRVPRFSATLSGPGNLGIGALEARSLALTLSGPGNIVLAGRAETAAMMLSGPGDIKAANLTARTATVQLSGPGDITATVTGTVQGTLTGPGDITIRGGARCDISKHGPGDVHCG